MGTADSRPGATVGRSRSSPPPTNRGAAMPFLHHARATVAMDQARMMLYADPMKVGCSRKDSPIPIISQ
jgi:hypothetical protein